MNYETLNQYKIPIIAGSFLAAVVMIGAFFYGFYSNDALAEQTAQSDQKQPEVDLKIKGNRKSRIYHLPGCPNYNDIAERNIRWFKTKDEAKAAGFRMAQNC